ncbi:MAG: mevalonate kinase [Anaerolineales bacterium]|nr:mevalonate kinase [Anaerolineales bacterium]
MPAYTASAPGKVILFGEHAVVYGQPAIAVPVLDVQAKAIIRARPTGEGINLIAPEISLHNQYKHLPLDDAIALAIRLTLDQLKVPELPACTLIISSTIPLAAGLGSGAAVSVAIIRAVSRFLGHLLPDETVNKLAFEVEKLHHGTPSGIDNTVITFSKPVYFVKGEPIAMLEIKLPFMLVIGDTGVICPTSVTVRDVRAAYDADPGRYETYFDLCGRIAGKAASSIRDKRNPALGPLMNDNHQVLQQIGVSSPELDTLVDAARNAGALGAKLSGGGRGGNMIALVEPHTAENVAAALREAGAVNTIITTVR